MCTFMIEDLRKVNKPAKNKIVLGKLLFYIKNNWITILIIVVSIFIIFFPYVLGYIIREWFDFFIRGILKK